ncbi:MAG: bifunctional (p)ppGpp synthetase/guanosine-3',5'-bis(diphosphate) 3'-pyrophosphohydrolase [Deltaproteobacteria bacterium]|nr:bifunctional (p)ppGpp synthetase/guanosine-3',5'-bis(diphosphate) 3'-pyrophosphohydrolase [Deltaproteobacteria bacterium]
MIKLQELKKQILAYNPSAQFDLIERAYHFAEEVHEGQKRASGEPYVVHPIEVAQILVQMKLDGASIAAALLHDTVEDTSASLEEIRGQFGNEIALLVDGVTKLGKIKFSSAEEKQAENFRKMVMAMAKDIRVVLIKLADRLNNMRTLDHLSEEKQLKIAKETLDIYAPLANRLGIQWIKIELEDQALKFSKPLIYKEIKQKMSQEHAQAQDYIQKVIQLLQPKFSEYKISIKISGRIKHYFSVYRKMQGHSISFEQVHDLMAFRIIVKEMKDCYLALGLIHELWTPIPGRFKDYIAMPKANNYQSLHTTVICVDGQRAEFQIRTEEMHEIAEKGIAAHWKYKDDGSIDQKEQEKFEWVRELLSWQKDLKDPAEFLDTLKLDLFVTDVYVFTPTGEVKELPHGATPVDFAYSIHSDLGNHCVGARVNDKIVPLNHRLHSGDVLEILSAPQQKPSKDWLKFAVSSRAKSKIRFYIKQEQREKSIQLGKELLEKEFEKYSISSSKYLKGPEFDQALQDLGYNQQDTLLMNIGYGKITPHSVLLRLLPEDLIKDKIISPKQEGFLSKIFKKVQARGKSAVQVGGYNDILVALAKCCSPLPGDPIVGFITRGRGVTVHVADCPKVLATDSERKVDVAWQSVSGQLHQAKLKVVSSDRPGLLASMTKLIANDGINISQASIRTTNDQKAINIFEVEIKDVMQLKSMMKSLERVSGVMSVERIRS